MQLKEQLDAQTKELAAFKGQREPSGSTPTVRLKLVSHVEVPFRAASRRARMSSPSGRQVNVLKAREGARGQNKEEEGGAEDGDINMKACADALDAQLRDTQGKACRWQSVSSMY